MGWFSLTGRDNQDPYMGIYDTLMDEKYDPEVNFLKLLSDYKIVAKDWLNFGRIMRDLPIKINGKNDNNATLSSVWLNEE